MKKDSLKTKEKTLKKELYFNNKNSVMATSLKEANSLLSKK